MKKTDYLDKGNPTLVAVNEVSTQCSRQLAAVDVIRQFRDIFQEDFLQKNKGEFASQLRHEMEH